MNIYYTNEDNERSLFDPRKRLPLSELVLIFIDFKMSSGVSIDYNLHLSRLIMEPAMSLCGSRGGEVSRCRRRRTSHQSAKNMPRATIFIPPQRPTYLERQ